VQKCLDEVFRKEDKGDENIKDILRMFRTFVNKIFYIIYKMADSYTVHKSVRR
jgi:hypothetical protein